MTMRVELDSRKIATIFFMDFGMWLAHRAIDFLFMSLSNYV